METITLNQAHDALQGFIINHSSYNFCGNNSEEYKLIISVGGLLYQVEQLIKKQKQLLAAPL